MIQDTALGEYLDDCCDAESDLLKHVHRETYLRQPQAHMLSGHYQGRVLSFFSKMKQPTLIVEIGTFTGYSSLCLAEGLADGGRLHTIDVDDELADQARNYFDLSEYKNQIVSHVGDAMTVLPTISGEWDLVFIDADKRSNEAYYELALEKLSTGGLILIDNVLWKGKIFQDVHDSKTSAIKEFNEYLKKDQRIEKLILPIRDGLFVLRKK